MEKHYAYMVRCSDGTLYSGYAIDLEARVKAHNEGSTAAKYTRARRPVQLVYFEEFDSKSEAMKREAAYKKLKKQQKEELVKKHLHKQR